MDIDSKKIVAFIHLGSKQIFEAILKSLHLYLLTTLSGTPGGGKGRFLGGGPWRYDLLSNRHSPIFPYVSSP